MCRPSSMFSRNTGDTEEDRREHHGVDALLIDLARERSMGELRVAIVGAHAAEGREPAIHRIDDRAGRHSAGDARRLAVLNASRMS